jgi:hypothetical protein
MMRKVLLYIGYLWSSPVSLLGFLLVLAAGGWKQVTTTDKVIWFELRYPWFLPKRFIGSCLGWVMYTRRMGPEMVSIIKHEHEHFRQCLYFGPLMFIFYPLACLFAIPYGDVYYYNFFEIQARDAETR